MRIQHNIMAMSAYQSYKAATGGLKKDLEKLSSGYRINRAGDDAAGLAISEKMRASAQGPFRRSEKCERRRQPCADRRRCHAGNSLHA